MFGTRIKNSYGFIYFFITSQQLIYNGSNIATVTHLNVSTKRLLQTSQLNVTKTDFGLVVIDSSSTTNGILL